MGKFKKLTRDEKRKAYNYLKQLTKTEGKPSRELNGEECDQAILELIAKVSGFAVVKPFCDRIVALQEKNDLLETEKLELKNKITEMEEKILELVNKNTELKLEKLESKKWYQFWR